MVQFPISPEVITAGYNRATERLRQITAQVAPNTSFADLKDRIIQHDWNHTLVATRDGIMQHVKDHPYETSFIAVTWVAPNLIVTPALGLVGFGPTGPIAGTPVAWVQSRLPIPAARGAFAYLQSAAMDGYGRWVADGAVRGLGAAWGARHINGTGG